MRRILTGLIVLTLLGAAAPSLADPVLFQVSGMITTVTGVATGSVATGDSWTGWLSYDPEVPPYTLNTFPIGFRVTFDGLTYWTRPHDTLGQVTGPRNLTFNWVMPNAAGPALGGSEPTLLLADLWMTRDIFNDPHGLPVITSADFASGSFALRFTEHDYDGGPFTGDVAGRMDSLTQVPEPTSLLLLGTGLAVAGFVRRKRQE